ncbi:alpha/beta hydrolase [Streptomyces anulatus]|uniref:alpha/beta hydrolase n=1 Tax=Streptomyces anulatus TaxID=1892 RepID=UPI00365725FD
MASGGGWAFTAWLPVGGVGRGNTRATGLPGGATAGRGRVPCADRAVNDYLRDGTLPAHDLTCPTAGRSER